MEELEAGQQKCSCCPACSRQTLLPLGMTQPRQGPEVTGQVNLGMDPEQGDGERSRVSDPC